MAEAKAFVVKGDDLIDITDKIAVMYDALVGSMDWGSQFLDVEDIDALLDVADLLGFALPGGELHVEGLPRASRRSSLEDQQIVENWRKRKAAADAAAIAEREQD